jgi:hypothetical protein
MMLCCLSFCISSIKKDGYSLGETDLDSYYSLDAPHAAKLCGSYWWRDIAKLMDNFHAVAKPDVKIGETILFWADEWEVDNSRIPLQQRFPRLFLFCQGCKDFGQRYGFVIG